MGFDGWVKVIGVIVACWTTFYVGKALMPFARRVITWAILPAERRLFQWLQDRAASRALGIDIEILRARRKIDGYG